MAKKPTYLQFGSNHISTLEAGDYSLKVSQKLKLKDSTHKFENQNVDEIKTTVKFSIQGERFALSPTAVHSVFPPENSLGEYSNVLPHIVINRSTLPWERHAVSNHINDVEELKKHTPWLALLVFREDEFTTESGAVPGTEKEKLQAQTGYVTRLDELVNIIPNLELETGQHPENKARVIYLKKETLNLKKETLNLKKETLNHKKETLNHKNETLNHKNETLNPILPSFEELQYLSHIRQGTDGEKSPKLLGDEMAVVIANRLPEPGATSVVHLVSMENRYTETGFNVKHIGKNGIVPLVSLKSWQFSSLSHKHTFRGLLLHLNQEQIFRYLMPSGLDLNNSTAELPIVLRDMFKKSKIILGSNAVITDRARKEIKLKDYHFLIGDSGKFYNEAGNLFSKLDDTSSDKSIVKGINDYFSEPKNEIPESTKTKSKNKIPKSTKTKSINGSCCWIEDGVKKYFIQEKSGFLIAQKLELDHAPVLRLPETGNKTADFFLQQGYAPMPHLLRQGSKTVSWYRSPLLTSEKKTSNLSRDIFSTSTGDELLIYHKKTGMFDVTYASAWELGRLLALQSKYFSMGLYKWRRAHARAVAHVETIQSHLHLPFSGATVEEKEVFPDALKNWLDRLWSLEGIPFNYLIPDEKMLPPESLRFFTLDPDWMACLVHGAFSVGKDTGTDHWIGQNNENHPVNQQLKSRDTISGFILKSELVSGWSGMQIEVYETKNDEPKPLVIKRNLSPGIILCLFEGKVEKVDFYLQPEVLHFGFYKDEDPGSFFKYPRDMKGNETEFVIDLSSIKLSQDKTIPSGEPILKSPESKDYNGVLNIKSLYDAISIELGQENNFNSAKFALSMIEGGDKVSFNRKNN